MNFLKRFAINFLCFLALSIVGDIYVMNDPLTGRKVISWLFVSIFFGLSFAWFMGAPFKGIMSKLGFNKKSA